MKNRKWLLVLLAGVLSFAITGCGLFGPEEKAGSNAIDPPPDLSEIPIMEQDDLIINEGAGAGDQFTVTDVVELPVYFVDNNNFVVPMGIQVPKKEGIAKETLRYMIKGGPVLSQIAGTDLEPVLPNGTEIIDMAINEGVARVNFTEEFLKYETKEQEKQIVEAVVWTLTEFPTIESVQFMVEGHLLDAMPVGGTSLTEPVSRSKGINIEVSGQASIGSPALTSQVMLYFQAIDSMGSMYYVPVTRIIPRTDDLVRAVVSETLQGPIQDQLYSAMLPTTKINKLDQQGKNLQIDFNDKLTTYGPGSQGELSVIQSLILGLTEMQDVENVSITINGEVPVSSSEENVQPMTRPQIINRIGL